MSSKKPEDFGMAKEHRIPPVRIRCMTWKQYQKLRKVWQGLGGKPLPARSHKKNNPLKNSGPP